MQIRTARVNDCDEIATLHVEVWAEVYTYIPRSVHERRDVEYRTKQWQDAVRPETSLHNPVAVLDVDAKVLGFSQVKLNTDEDVPDPDFELHACYLSPSLRGTTAGPLMMHAMLDDVIALGGVSCLIWVWVKNPIKWTYFGLGFKTMCRRNRIIGGVDLPEIGVVSNDLPGLQKSLKTMIKRIEQSLPTGNQSRRPSRQNPICERIGKSREPNPKSILV